MSEQNMTLAEKILSLVENEMKIYRAGYDRGKEEGGGSFDGAIAAGDGEDSIIANDIINNVARTVLASAFGNACAAGAFGFKIKSLLLDEENNMATYVIEYDEGGVVKDHLIDLARYSAAGDQLTASVIYSNNYDLCGNVIEVNLEYAEGQGAIVIDNVPQTIKGTGKELVPESDGKWTADNSINTIRIFEHPELGNVDVGTAAFAAGMNSKALAEMAIALGYGAVAAGRCGMAVNRGTLAVWGAFAANEYSKALNLAASAFGRYTQALGEASFSRGISTRAIGHGSDASGNHTEARGGASHAGGSYTVADEYAQTAIGLYNKPEPTAMLIVGNGTAEKRSNCFTTGTKDGVAYISIGNAGLTVNTDACEDLDVWECVGDGTGREYYQQTTIDGVLTVKVARSISTKHNADTSQVSGATVYPGTIWGGWSLITGGIGEAVLIIMDNADTSKTTTVKYTATADDNVVAVVGGYEKMGADRRYCRYHFNISDYTALPLDSNPCQTYDFSGKNVRIHIGFIPKADPECEPIIIWTRNVNIAKA